MSQGPGFETKEPQCETLDEQSGNPEDQSTRKIVTDSSETENPRSSAKTTPKNNSSQPPIPTRLIAEKYQVIEKLGSGGLSSVYRVRHLHLDKIYALKLLHELKEESILRFQQEAKAASLLQHQNIVEIVDFGVFNGAPYMVMNCVEGQTLSQYARNNSPLDPRKCARIFGEICAALAHAHEKGVVHRDIKPSNIMISFDENCVEHAVLVDFGIAKITNEQLGNFNSQLTRTGDIFGTPLYMSPEQCKGMAVDARSDIYSLACVMYEVLTGTPPFPGDSPYEIIHKQITEAPRPFSSKLRSSPLIAKLEALILKAMAKSPEDRFQYMLEMASALKALELGAKDSRFSLAGLNLAVARFKASDKQKVVFKIGIVFSALLSITFATMLVFFPAELERLNSRIKIENEIIARSKEVFTFRYDQGASLFRIKRSETKIKLTQIKELAKFDREISSRFAEVAKSILYAADKVHNLRGLKKTLIPEEAPLTLSQLAALKAKLDNIEFRLGEASNCWSEANLQSVDLSNWISRQVELEERRMGIIKALLLLSEVLVFPSLGFLAFSIYMVLSTKRKEQLQLPGSLPPSLLQSDREKNP